MFSKIVLFFPLHFFSFSQGMQTRERAHYAHSVFPFIKKEKKKKLYIYIEYCIYIYIYIYCISRIRRNLSIHIARFSASESPRVHTNTPKNHHFSLVAGTSPGAMRRGSDSACVSIPHGHSFFARICDILCSF